MNVAVQVNSQPVSVVTALYQRTKALHVEAEGTGVINELLRGEACRDEYILFLRNLLPAYRELESGLEQHGNSPAMRALAIYKLDRGPAIQSDLEALCGKGWADKVPLLPAGENYARKVADAATEGGDRLIAHAYARYLGDLSGGLILQRLLIRSLELSPSELNFYDFPQYEDLSLLKKEYREALDLAGASAKDPEAVIEEGALAFSLNIDLSMAVQRAASIRSG
ncbi:heme oxygenase (biliverdin-producing) [Afipia sp. DC4300-2b1]|uniref:biliverdin-producing heme oxygenase n=1 Tax=Afipia sp. DC4300-2b1 TaxID=2804672 RepID=UPI003CF9A11B